MMIRPTRGRRLRFLPIANLLPNMLTVLGLCSGLTAIRFAVDARYELAVIALLVAMVFDALDGRLARLLKVTSDFGAQLDSLADIVNFGVAPALVLYMWSVNALGGLGWGVSLLFATCCMLRLARFNVALSDDQPAPLSTDYFTGVPAPAGCGLALLPMVLCFALETDQYGAPVLVAGHMLVVALLMISRVRTFSFKRFRIKHEYALVALVLMAVLAALTVSYPWWTLLVAGTIYLLSIPLGIRSFIRAKKALGLSPRSAKQKVSETLDKDSES